MTAKFVLLMFAGLGLAACSTSSPAVTAQSDPRAQPEATASAPVVRRVVRGEVVPDEPEPPRAKSRPAAKIASAASVPEPTTAASLAPAESTPVAPADAQPTEILPPEPPKVITAPALSPVAPPANTNSILSGIKMPAVMEMMIFGLPLWLVVLIIVGVLAALALAFGGRPSSEHPDI